MTRLPLILLLAPVLSSCAIHHDWRHGKHDRDADGVANRYDHCPATPHGLRVDYVGCHTDADGDGVPDGLDRCPDSPAGARVDYLGCPLDSDCDGIVDLADECPNSPAGSRVDARGCSHQATPAAPASPPLSVYFPSDSSSLDHQALNTLQSALRQLQNNPDWQVQLEGHADSRASDSYNLALSWRRIAAVRAWLKDNGVPETRFRQVPYGDSAPRGDNTTSSGRAVNRRVDLHFLPAPSSPAGG